MDKGTEKKELTPEEAQAEWKQNYNKQRDDLLKKIGALQTTMRLKQGGANLTLGFDWTLKVFEYLQDYLEAFDAVNDILYHYSQSLKSLGKRLELLEAESSERAKHKQIGEMH